MQLDANGTVPPLSLIAAHTEQMTRSRCDHVSAVRAMTRLSRTSRRSRIVVDLTCQHTNHTVLVEGPEITIRPVGTRRVTGGPR
jgi:hypothetical protein